MKERIRKVKERIRRMKERIRRVKERSFIERASSAVHLSLSCS